MKKHWPTMCVIIGLIMLGFQIHSFLKPKLLSATTSIYPLQGGTGINTATTSNIGQVLTVSSSNPFVYKFANASSASGKVSTGTPGQFPYYATNTTTLTATSALFILPSGNIGINSTSPIDTLGINGGLQIIGGATSTNLAVTTLATTTAGTCLQSNSLGSIFNGFCPTMANQTLFFQNSSSSITQYKSMIALTQTGAENFVTTTGVVDAQVLMGWASATNSPNVATILAGTYSLKIRASQTAGSKSGFIYGQIFTRTAGGAETLLGTTAASPLLTSVETEINLSVFISATDTPITNRFVVKFFSTVTGGGTAPTIVLGYGDATAAGFNFPSTAADITLLVPYSGWLSNVNGGSFGLTVAFVSTTNATTTNLWLQTLYDSTGSKGTNGMVLQTNGTIDTWVTTSSLNISGGGNGTISSGLAGQNAFYGADGTTLIGTSSLFILPNKSINVGTTTNPIGATFNVADVSGLMTANFASSLGVSYFHIMDVGMTGINTSTPSERLTIVGTGTENPFAIRTSTAAAASMLNVLTNGNVGINTNTPTALLGIQAVTGKDTFDIVSSTGGGLMVQIDPSGNINIGTNAIDQTITIGNITGATGVSINGGTGNMNFANNAIAHTTVLGSVTGGSNTTVQAGTGALNLNGIATSNGVQVNENNEQQAFSLSVNSTAGSINTGGNFRSNKTAASGSTAFTGIMNSFIYNQTSTGGTITNTGQMMVVSRNYALNAAGITQGITGAVMAVTDNAVITTGTALNSAADVLDVTQNYTSNTGTVLKVVNNGTGVAFSASGTTRLTGIPVTTAGDAVCINTTNGNIEDSGATACVISTEYWKEHIKSLSPEVLLAEVMKLRPVGFDFKPGSGQFNEDHGIAGGGVHNSGFIAEEVAQVDPLLVEYVNQSMYKPERLAWVKKNYPQTIIYRGNLVLIPQTVSYARMAYLYAGAFQAQQKVIEQGKKDLADYKAYNDKRVDLLMEKVGIQQSVLEKLLNWFKHLFR